MNRLLLLFFLSPLFLNYACNTSESSEGEEEETEAITADNLLSQCQECIEEGDSDDIEACLKEMADGLDDAALEDDDLLEEFHEKLVTYYVSTECDCYDADDIDDITDCIDDMWEWDYTVVGSLSYEGLIDEDDFWDDYYDDLYDECEDEKYAYEDEYYGYDEEYSDVEYAAEELCWCMEDYMDGYYTEEEMNDCLADVESWYSAEIIEEAYEWWYVEDYCPEAYEYVMGE
jgi:hypothetical protein